MSSIRSPAHKARNDQFRTMFADLEAAKALVSPTASTISSRVEALGHTYLVRDIPNSQGARLHYIGELDADKALLYFHVSATEDKGKSCLTEVAEGLSDKEKYPVQLKQAIEALRYIIDSGKRPSDVIVAGDSAGGNMCFSLASHILHPLNQISPLVLSERLAGMLLISPLVCFDQDSPSYTENTDIDICSPKLLKDMGDAWVPKARNNYTDPLFASATWWEGFPATKVLNLYGEHELLRDHAAAIGKDLIAAKVDVKNIECPLHVHVECILDSSTGLEQGVMANEAWSWLSQVFSQDE